MPDDVALVELLHRDLRNVTWPEPETIRATARRRSRRSAALAAVSVVVVAALTATLVDRTGAPPPPAGAVGGPGEIVAEAMLEPADIPVPIGERLGETGLDEPVRVDDLLQICAGKQGRPAEEPRSRYSRSQTLMEPPTEPATTIGSVLTQDVYRMEPGAAGRFVTDLEGTVAACGAWRTTSQVYTERGMAGAEVVHRWYVAASGFAGDQALLLRHEASVAPDEATGRPPGYAPLFGDRLVVRVGDLVTVLIPSGGLRTDVPEPRVTEEQVRQMARVAAERMCVASNPGC
ncbi:hypothetical protein ACFWRG_14590 [Micromonospora tulbaghiae]|uniref:PknH-like extracellular domain-containing protein n=1 Tax=Micromonospora tulbaghiae TaxID=479978 RepID=A0ABY0KH27_9ACTN|nr:hypothetical protein [Micromonospora tulbaghiae]MDX5456151.1 hypothetical protein [Micromonospora tulbaghiae]SCE71040.1 hypothetical protein GA0070562_1982 [Micromonospora tulbaghiae]